MATFGIAASGPSLTLEDCQYLRKHCDQTIAINDTWRMIHADHLYAADSHWWHHHIKDVRCGFTGKKWSCDTPTNTNWNRRDPEEYGINVLQCDVQAEGLCKEDGKVHTGGNSGYQGINLAYHLGAVRIILLGYDMSCHSGKSHWFGDHPAAFNSNSDPRRFIERFRTIKPADYGIEIINCSRVTKLDAFPCKPLDEVF